jgi:hypothetical protein
MPSHPQLSVCVPDSSEFAILQEFYSNVNQFFLKFPLPYEIVFAVESNQDQSRNLLKGLSDTDPRVRTLEVGPCSSRAKKLELLFAAAHGDLLVASSLELSIPLGEIFNMLQELYTDKDLQAVFGNRFEKKKAPAKSPFSVPPTKSETGGARTNPDPRERFFQGIITEKTSWPIKDAFCPTLALRKTTFETLRPYLKSTGWHWTPEVQRAVSLNAAKALEVPVFEAPPRPGQPRGSAISWLEFLRLLSFVIFRI